MTRDPHASVPVVFRTVVALVAALASIGGCTSSSEPQPSSMRLEAVTATQFTSSVGSDVNSPPVVRVIDGAGSPMSGIRIHFAVEGGGSVLPASVETDVNGTAAVQRWTLGTISGPFTLAAKLVGHTDVRFTAIAAPGSVATLTLVSGNRQFSVVSATLPNPLHAVVADAFGNRVGGAVVNFAVITGEGRVERASAIADSYGIASAGAWTLGPIPQLQQVHAQSGNAEAMFVADACEPSACPQLLFARDGRIQLFAGGVTTPLTSGSREGYPAWSPDGQRIAFVKYDSNWIGDIYLMNADGSNVVRRTNGGDFGFPAWSPDGRTLAVSTTRNVPYDAAIWLLSVDSGGPGPVAIADAAAMPAWSPDGRRIAFVSLSGDDGYHALHVVNADGTELAELTTRDQGSLGSPSWSPDGRSVAFSKCVSGACDIHVVDLSDLTVRALTSEQTAVSPRWSSDGSRLAFVNWVHSQSTTVTSLAYLAAYSPGGPFSMGLNGQSPAWRPEVSQQRSSASEHASRDRSGGPGAGPRTMGR